MTDPELNRLVEAWKMTIQVQQHFNDIEMKIRGLAITVLTAVVGAAALAIQNGRAHLAVGIFFMGLVAWLLFLFVDHFWYHRLLIGAVKQGKVIEELLPAAFGLSTKIAEESPVKKFPKVKILSPEGELHSAGKLLIFYGGVAVLLLGAMVVTGLFAPDTTPASSASSATQHSPSPSSHR